VLDGREHGGIITAVGRYVPEPCAVYARVFTAANTVESICIDIVDQVVWSTFAQGRIQVLDLLVSRLARVLVRVSDDQESVEEFALSVPHDSTIGDVVAAYMISDQRISVAARPLPRKNASEMRGE